MKLQVTCPRCGFVGFVDRDLRIQLVGWRADDLQNGRAVCPACIEDEHPVMVRTVASSASAGIDLRTSRAKLGDPMDR
jgi:hypothetical protein